MRLLTNGGESCSSLADCSDARHRPSRPAISCSKWRQRRCVLPDGPPITVYFRAGTQTLPAFRPALSKDVKDGPEKLPVDSTEQAAKTFERSHRSRVRRV
jgi:hypothetical protein